MHRTARWTAHRSYAVLAFILIIILLILAGCASVKRGEKRTTIPAPVGNPTRAVVGNESRSTTRGAIFGAAIDGAAGSIIGQQMDQQAKEIEQHVAGATVERVAQGIQVTFASGLLYDVHDDRLRPEAEQNLRNLATTFDRYRDTDLLIVGHADSAGSDSYNQALSERRARSVSDFLVRQGTPVGRLHAVGRGETEPLDSTVAAGRHHDNERVEVAIFASVSYRNELTRQRYSR
jgi:outer membrane protein OmpA-like peptidoglycan-associated protein